MKARVVHSFVVAALISGTGLLIISGLVGGWRWTYSRVASGASAAALAPKQFTEWALGNVRARQGFDPNHPRLFADHFAGELVGLADYTAPAPFSGCGVSFWRIRETDPRGVVIIRDHIGQDGKFRCERVDLYAAEAPAGLPDWADEVSCLRDDGSELRFAVEVDRLLDIKPREWMKHYNRTVILFLESRASQGQLPGADT